MPARAQAKPKPREYFQNATTWKQISTNVPPKMLEVLKSRVTKDFTMSHVLREVIAESSLMRYGQLPRPSWCAELIDQVAALREEVSAERQARAEAEKAFFELKQEIADLRKEVVPLSITDVGKEPPPILALVDKEKAQESGGCLDKPTLWGRLSEMLGVARKTA